MALCILLLLVASTQDISFSVHQVAGQTTTTTTPVTPSAQSTPNATGTAESPLLLTTLPEAASTNSSASTEETLFTPNRTLLSPAPSHGPSTTTGVSSSPSNAATGPGAATSPATPTSQVATSRDPSAAADLPLSQNPGLVAVICIFVSILLIGSIVILVKFCHRREPAFKKLDEVPMGKVAEDSPFARYPPK